MSKGFLDVENARVSLRRLADTIADFARREQELTRHFHSQTYHLSSDLDGAVEQIDEQYEAAVAAETERYSAELDRLDTRHRNRRQGIVRGHKNSQKRIVEEIQKGEGHLVYAAQKATLDSDRSLDQRLLEADRVFGELSGQADTLKARLDSLQKKSRAALRGYAARVKQLAAQTSVETSAAAPAGVDSAGLGAQLSAAIDESRDALRRFQKRMVPQLFRFVPLPVALIVSLVLCVGAVPMAQSLEIFSLTYLHSAIGFAVIALLLVLFYFIGKATSSGAAQQLIDSVAGARALEQAFRQQVGAELQAERDAVKAERGALTQRLENERKQAAAQAATLRASGPEQIDQQMQRAVTKNDAQYQARKAQLAAIHDAQLATLRADADAQRQALSGDKASSEEVASAELEQGWQVLKTEWDAQVPAMYAQLAEAGALADAWFPDWSQEFIDHWQAPDVFAHAAKFGELEVDLAALAGTLPKDERLSLPGDTEFTLPMLLGHPQHGSLLIESEDGDKAAMIGALNNIILRLLSVSAPGKASFTVIDPVGLGENFAGLMHLADHEEGIINSRIWTQPQQIEQRLGELNDHMEKVIQMYLRNEYATITEYNLKAGNIAEKYHFLVVADFPAAFSDAAAKRLLSIAVSGARCGVFTLIHWNLRQPMPQDFVAAEFREACVRLTRLPRGGFALGSEATAGLTVRLDAPPSPDIATKFIAKVGAASKDSNRVEVPFSMVTPPEGERWTRETTHELVVPIGRTGATKFQDLAIGKGTRQHALIAGKTGSGKSTLFHVIITNLALWCRPDQVEFYLIDFKKGVEFKGYATARLPHARVVAIESDREFAESVLTRVDEELKRRGDLFRSLGVQDIAGYQRAGGTEPMPRTLLMIDEFQEFFVEEDRIAQNANVLLDRIVRQGRAFGIHVILGSQTLGGAYTLARTTMGQMVIRIALQCNEADAYLIMDDSNPAPRLLTRPGEGIYNDSAGAVEGNSPFQAVWIGDEERDQYLAEVRQLADKESVDYPGPIVFEGNAPAEIRDNHLLAKALAAAPASASPAGGARVWFGAPNSIKGPTEIQFARQSGCNLLVAGQRDEAALSILTAAMVALAAQHPKDGARFILFDGSPPDSPPRRQIEALVEAIPHEVILAKNNTIGEVMAEVHADLRRRGDDEAEAGRAPAVYLMVHGIQRIKKLRYEEAFSFSLDDDDEGGGNPGSQFNDILLEGPGVGIHSVVFCDTFNNINRFLSRKAISEFELRVLFQMSANDSASLIDTPKASNLGLHRALFYNEQEGYLETFRPYALPDTAWLKEVREALS